MKSSRTDAAQIESIRVHAEWQRIKRSTSSPFANTIRTGLYALRHDDHALDVLTPWQRLIAALRGIL